MNWISMVAVAVLVLVTCLVMRWLMQLAVVLIGDRECPQCGENLVERGNGEWVCEGCGLVVGSEDVE